MLKIMPSASVNEYIHIRLLSRNLLSNHSFIYNITHSEIKSNSDCTSGQFSTRLVIGIQIRGLKAMRFYAILIKVKDVYKLRSWLRCQKWKLLWWTTGSSSVGLVSLYRQSSEMRQLSIHIAAAAGLRYLIPTIPSALPLCWRNHKERLRYI